MVKMKKFEKAFIKRVFDLSLSIIAQIIAGVSLYYILYNQDPLLIDDNISKYYSKTFTVQVSQEFYHSIKNSDLQT